MAAPLIAAIDALIAAGVREEAARLLARYGPELIRSGQAGAVARLETELGIAGTPAALLLHARVTAEQDAPGALAAFLAAHRAAVAAGADYTAVQSACGALQAMFKVWGDFSMLRALVPFAGRGFGAGIAHPDPTSELECCTGLLVGWLLTQPGDPRNGELAERMFALLAGPAAHPTARLAAAGVLLAQCQLTGDTGRGIATVRMLAPELDNERIPLEHRLMWSYEAALFRCLAPAPDNAAVAAELAAHRARLAAGVATAHVFRCARLDFESACSRSDVGAAEKALAAMHQTQDPALPAQSIMLAHREATHALGLGHYPRALRSARQAVAQAERVGVPDVIVDAYRINVVHALTYSGEFAAATELARALAQGARTSHWKVYSTLERVIPILEAYAHSADPTGALRQLLAHMAEVDYYRAFGFRRDVGACAMAFALARAIHPDVARKVIAAMQFAPPPDLPEAWPWTVRLRLFGTPEVEVDGEAVGGKGKAQQRPLELLQLLALSGAADDAGADTRALAEVLWPDAESDPKATFDVVLMRLRKLLRHDGVITLADGRARFDRRRVWCDVWAFSARTAGTERAPAVLLDDLFSLYRGPLLGDGPAPAWAISRREQLRIRFLRAVADVGAAIEAAGDWAAAARLYERGIAQDPLAEDFYRGLMRCHVAMGEAANALRAYRRCRELLSIVLGVAPSAETEAERSRILGRE